MRWEVELCIMQQSIVYIPGPVVTPFLILGLSLHDNNNYYGFFVNQTVCSNASGAKNLLMAWRRCKLNILL